MYLDFFLFVANDVGNNPMGPFFLLRLLFDHFFYQKSSKLKYVQYIYENAYLSEH